MRCRSPKRCEGPRLPLLHALGSCRYSAATMNHHWSKGPSKGIIGGQGSRETHLAGHSEMPHLVYAAAKLWLIVPLVWTAIIYL